MQAQDSGETGERTDGAQVQADDDTGRPALPLAEKEDGIAQNSQLPSYMRSSSAMPAENDANAPPTPPARTLGQAVARGSSNSIPPFADITVSPEGVAKMHGPSESDMGTAAVDADASNPLREPVEIMQEQDESPDAAPRKNEFWTTRLRPEEDETSANRPADANVAEGENAHVSTGTDAYTAAGENAYAAEPGREEEAGDVSGTGDDTATAEGAAAAGKGRRFLGRAKRGDTKEPRDKKPGFFSTHPKLAAEQSMPPSIGSRFFTVLALMPILPLTFLLLAQVAFSLDARDLWYSDEIRHADAFRSMLHGGSWFVLHMNGEIYPDKPPLYFWFLRGLYELLQQEGPLLYFGAAALSGLLFLWASIFLGRFVARVDARTMLASGILLVCGCFFMGLLHYARMDLLFSTLVVCSYAAFYHAWIRPQSISCMLLAFMFGALAVLTKGPLGLALPLAASILFLFWRGTPLRLFRWDTLLGLLVGAVIIGSWAGAASLELGGHEQFVDLYITKQTLNRVFDAFHHQQPWYYYLLALPLMVLPWTLLLLALPWLAPFGKKWWQGLAASRKPEGEGLGYMWCIVLSALALLSAISGKLLIYFLPALPALCIIMGRAILQLTPRRAAFFRHSLALLLLVLGLAFIAATLMIFGYLPMPEIKGIPGWRLPPDIGFFAVGGGIVFTAFFLWLLLHSSRPEGVLLVVGVCFTLISFPLAVMVAPSFDSVLSPRGQALVLKELAGKGYMPVSFKDYGGTYSYYAGQTIMETSDRQAVQDMADRKDIALAVRLKDWEDWENRPSGCAEVHRQWIETKVHLLLACTPRAAEEHTTPVGTDGGEGVITPEQDTGIPIPADSTPVETPGETSGPGEIPPSGAADETGAHSGPASEQAPARNQELPSVTPEASSAPADDSQAVPAQPSGRTLGDWQPEGAAPGEEPLQEQ